MTIGSVLYALLFLQACASQEERDARMVDLNRQCPPGRTMVCQSRGYRRLGPRRIAERNDPDNNCRCDIQSDVDVLRGVRPFE